MRKLLVALATAALAVAFMVAMSGTAAAQQGSGKDCPPSSPGGQNDPPSQAPDCGHADDDGNGNGGGNGTDPSCRDGEDNDMDGDTDGADSECQDPNDGVEDGSDVAPAGNCANADLVLLTEDAKILCLYNGEISQEEIDEECPDALLALGSPIGGACLFLPPAESALTSRL